MFRKRSPPFRKKTREGTRRWTARGLVDVGVSTLPLSGFEKGYRWSLWDDDED